MPKNILVVTGSPRKGGNSDKLADAFISGALKVGQTVTKYSTADMKIAGCRDCMACYSQGKPCVVQDDFNALAELVDGADMIVLATPMYWFSFPAQLKAAIDRFYSFIIGNRLGTAKQMALLACSGDADATGFDGMTSTYRRIVKKLDWEDRGILSVPGVFNKDDILGTDALKRAEDFGASLA